MGRGGSKVLNFLVKIHVQLFLLQTSRNVLKTWNFDWKITYFFPKIWDAPNSLKSKINLTESSGRTCDSYCWLRVIANYTAIDPTKISQQRQSQNCCFLLHNKRIIATKTSCYPLKLYCTTLQIKQLKS